MSVAFRMPWFEVCRRARTRFQVRSRLETIRNVMSLVHQPALSIVLIFPPVIYSIGRAYSTPSILLHQLD